MQIDPYRYIGLGRDGYSRPHTMRVVINGHGQGQVIQVQERSGLIVHAKPRDAETFARRRDGMYRLADSSAQGRIYRLLHPGGAGVGALWMKSPIRIGETHVFRYTIEYYDRLTGRTLLERHEGQEQLITPAQRFATWRAADHFDASYAAPFQDVIRVTVAWGNGVALDEMYYAAGHGLVGWRDYSGSYSHVNGWSHTVQRGYDIFEHLDIWAMPQLPYIEPGTPPAEEPPMSDKQHRITSLGRVNARNISIDDNGKVWITPPIPPQLQPGQTITITGKTLRAKLALTEYTWYELADGRWFAGDVMTTTPPLPPHVDTPPAPEPEPDDYVIIGPNIMPGSEPLSEPPADVRAGGIGGDKIIAIPGGGWDVFVYRHEDDPFVHWNNGGYRFEPAQATLDATLLARNRVLHRGVYVVELRVDADADESDLGNMFWRLRFNIDSGLHYSATFNAVDHAGKHLYAFLSIRETVALDSIGLHMFTNFAQEHGALIPRYFDVFEADEVPPGDDDKIIWVWEGHGDEEPVEPTPTPTPDEQPVVIRFYPGELEMVLTRKEAENYATFLERQAEGIRQQLEGTSLDN